MAREVRVAIIGDPSSLQRALRTADGGVNQFGQRMQAFGSRMRSVGSSLSRNLTLPLVGFGILAYRELSQGERALAQTQAVIESTGGAARKSVDDIVELSQSLSELTSLDDEPIQEAANTLLTFRNIAGDTFDEATQATLDLSVAMDRDLRGSAVMVGRALNDPMRGLAALTRVGVQFTDEQRAAVEAMVAFGDTAGAQQLILAELNEEFGGSAEALGGTVSGRLNRVKNQMENMGASILEDLMPALEDLADGLSWVANSYSTLTPLQQKFVGGLVALAALAGPLTTLLGGVATALGAIAAALGVSAGLVAVVIVALVGLAVGLVYVIRNWQTVQMVAANAINNIKANVPGASQVITVLGWNLQIVTGFWRGVFNAANAAFGAMERVGGLTLSGLRSAVEAIAAALDRIISLAQTAQNMLGGVSSAIPTGGFAGGAVGGESAFFPSRPAAPSPAAGLTPLVAAEVGRAMAAELRKQPLMTVGVG